MVGFNKLKHKICLFYYLDSQERIEESASTVASHANLEENNANERDRMHYNLAGNTADDNRSSTPSPVQIGEQNLIVGQTTTGMATIPKAQVYIAIF